LERYSMDPVAALVMLKTSRAVPHGRQVMRVAPLLLLFGLWTAPAAGADLSKIDRTIAKEPVYKTKPQYCLLVFGREARVRVWVVFDGDTVYLDRNGDGDLTAKNERFEQTEQCKDIEIADPDGQTRYAIRSLGTDTNGKGRNLTVWIVIKGPLTYSQLCSVELVDHPSGARVAHFHGRLTARLQNREGTSMPQLAHGDKPWELYASIDTLDPANGCYVVIYSNQFRADIHPVAEVQFPPKRPGEKPILRRYLLKQRC